MLGRAVAPEYVIRGEVAVAREYTSHLIRRNLDQNMSRMVCEHSGRHGAWVNRWVWLLLCDAPAAMGLCDDPKVDIVCPSPAEYIYS